MALIGDFLKALAQIGDRRFLGVLAMSLGLTVALLVAFAAGAGWVAGFLPARVDLPLVGEVALPISGLQGLAVGAVILGSSFLMIPVAAAFVSLFLERIADAVERRHYPNLPDTPGPGLFASALSALRFTAVVIGVNLVGLVVYLLAGPLAPLVFYAVNGYLLGREYFQLVAERHLNPREAEALRRRHWPGAWLAGTLMTIPLTVPVLNLIVPVLGVATFTHQVHRLRARDAGRGAR